METINVLGICGSLRQHSTNMGLLKFAQANAPAGITVNIARLNELPFYNADLLEVPEPVKHFKKELGQADALLFACPEYNYSISPALKNSLDWASREEDNALLAGKPAAILGAGGGMGSARAQYHLRQICVFLDIHPLNKPEVFSSAFDGSFDEQGVLVNTKVQQLIVEQLSALHAWSQTLG